MRDRLAACLCLVATTVVLLGTTSWNTLRIVIESGRSDGPLRIGMSSLEVKRIMGDPKEKLNYMGGGYYAFDNTGVFFDDVVGSYEEGEFVKNDAEVHVEAICWFGGGKVFGITAGKTDKKDVLAKYGSPDLEKTFEPDADGEGRFSGNAIIYASGHYSLALFIGDNDIVTACYLAPERWFE